MDENQRIDRHRPRAGLSADRAGTRHHYSVMANVEAVKPAAQGARYGQVFAAGPFRALFGGTVLTIVATSSQMLGSLRVA